MFSSVCSAQCVWPWTRVLSPFDCSLNNYLAMLQVLKLDRTYTTGEESACYLIGSLIKNLASQVNLDSLVNFAAFKEYGIPTNPIGNPPSLFQTP